MKHLHHAAEQYDIGVYFEANGHGTVLFSQPAQDLIFSHKPSTPAQSTALTHLQNIINVINQTVGDALSDMLLVEAVLAHKSYGGAEWDSLYADLPNRLVKVVVSDRNVFRTEDAERRLVSPLGLQAKIDDLVKKYDGGRSFVRPSGTEDVVRVYAEAALKGQADGEIDIGSLDISDTVVYRTCIPRSWIGVRRSRGRSSAATQGIFVTRFGVSHGCKCGSVLVALTNDRTIHCTRRAVNSIYRHATICLLEILRR